MRSIRILLITTSACAVLAACGPKTPSGQVVATVGKHEITSIDLRNEMQGFQAPNAQVRKAAEQQALNNIIQRRVLADAAEKAGVAKTPEFAGNLERGRETLLVQSWQAALAKQVPAPTAGEVDKFVSEHPDMYAQHKVFEVDQVRFPRISDVAILKEMQPLTALDQVTALLTSHKIPFRAGPAEIDALALDPTVVTKLLALPSTDVFVVPNNNQLIANHIREIKVVPVPPDQASKHASAFLQQQRTREALQRRFSGVLAAAKKDVKYSKAYEPAPPPKAGAPVAAAVPTTPVAPDAAPAAPANK